MYIIRIVRSLNEDNLARITLYNLHMVQITLSLWLFFKYKIPNVMVQVTIWDHLGKSPM